MTQRVLKPRRWKEETWKRHNNWNRDRQKLRQKVRHNNERKTQKEGKKERKTQKEGKKERKTQKDKRKKDKIIDILFLF